VFTHARHIAVLRHMPKESPPMPNARSSILMLVALIVLGAILALLYRSASNDELPDDDEWFDFEHPGKA
jgi:hypothetical protein